MDTGSPAGHAVTCCSADLNSQCCILQSLLLLALVHQKLCQFTQQSEL